MLRSFVEQPLIEKSEIEKRQDAIAEINKHIITREELREYLNPIYDLERLITRVTYMTANPRDLIAFKNSIGMLPPIKTLLNEFQCEMLKELHDEMDTLEELYNLIDAAIIEEPPISVCSRSGSVRTRRSMDGLNSLTSQSMYSGPRPSTSPSVPSL